MHKFNSILLTTMIVCFNSGGAMASGGGGSGYSWGLQSQETVDTKYEAGKLYYHSAKVNGKKIRYCVKNGEELQRLSRRSLKPFENSTTSDLSDNLYNCDQPEQLIADQIDRNQVSAVVYYLNKRYRLSLLSNS